MTHGCKKSRRAQLEESGGALSFSINIRDQTIYNRCESVSDWHDDSHTAMMLLDWQFYCRVTAKIDLNLFFSLRGKRDVIMVVI